MNTRMNHLNPLCAALRGAHLARAGAMLALALGAAQAGAVTYTVPLQFNITLVAPVCSLTVGGTATVDATTANGVHPTGHTVDLTPSTATPLSAISSPNTIAAGLTGIATSNITANAFGVALKSTWAVQRLITSLPAAEVLCTSGTPVIARLSKGSTAFSAVGIDNTVQAGAAGSLQSIPGTTLPVGMLMGMSSFAGTNGASGTAGTTNSASEPTIAGVATGSVQNIALTAAVYAHSPAALPSAAAGLWTYKFNVNLDF